MPEIPSFPAGPAPAAEPRPVAAAPAGLATRSAVLELRVRNHPGTMSHITGLFARRAFNLEAIVCTPVGDGAASGILLLVADEPRLDQVERQLARLHDVLTVRLRPDLDARWFERLVPPERPA
jgi:acetolactate synthase I/III small subunit